jgi:hypothetical protein
VYRPRDAEHTVLHQVIREHLEPFLRAAAEAEKGRGLPPFVEREFRDFLTCGLFEHGFARFRCEGCAFEHVVPYSCKGRGFCPSCGGRRMTERASLPDGAGTPRARYCSWATLMHRAFELDVLACPRCGSRLRFIGIVDDPDVIRRLLAHRGLARSGRNPGPPGPIVPP